MRQGGKRITWKGRACIAAIAVMASLSVFASAAQALPANFWGVVPQLLPSEEQFLRLKRGGVDSVRIPLVWSAIQPTRGSALDWSETDAAVARAAVSGIQVLPFVAGAPSWAVPSTWVPGSGHSVKAPVHLPVTGAAAAGWKALLKQAIARYGPNGAFWAENPTLPKRPLRTWQVWNEENFQFFVTKPNPAEYGKLVKLSSATIKDADPGAKVLLGGMFSYPKGCSSAVKPKSNYCAADFLEEMYEKTPGIKAKFDGVALHPYTTRYQELTPYIEELRSVMSANHDASKGLWITELGWSSQAPDPLKNVFAKGPAGQAAQLKGAFSLLERNQRKWKIQQVYWFSVDDLGNVCNFCSGSGLFASGFVPKKSWYAYVKFAGGTP
jgi:hypothetical protein